MSKLHCFNVMKFFPGGQQNAQKNAFCDLYICTKLHVDF